MNAVRLNARSFYLSGLAQCSAQAMWRLRCWYMPNTMPDSAAIHSDLHIKKQCFIILRLLHGTCPVQHHSGRSHVAHAWLHTAKASLARSTSHPHAAGLFDPDPSGSDSFIFHWSACPARVGAAR